MLKVHKVLVVAWPDLFVFVSLSLPLSLCFLFAAGKHSPHFQPGLLEMR